MNRRRKKKGKSKIMMMKICDKMNLKDKKEKWCKKEWKQVKKEWKKVS